MYSMLRAKFMSEGHDNEKPSYLTELKKFYLESVSRSALLILYLVFFLYAAIFYSDHAVLALKFVWYIFWLHTSLLDLSFLFWGALFFISLLVPFAASLYAIAMPFEICKLRWGRNHTVALIILIAIAAGDLMYMMDRALVYLETKKPVIAFLEHKQLKENLTAKNAEVLKK